MTGVLAAEGNLRKTDAQGNRAFDYADGRYGDPDADGGLAAGNHVHAGLAGEWTLRDGDDCLSLTLVRYDGNAVQTESRFFVNIQVGRPDATLTQPEVKPNKLKNIKPGKKVEFKGSWANVGSGLLRNYAELDVYHISDITTPVWVGTLAGATANGIGSSTTAGLPSLRASTLDQLLAHPALVDSLTLPPWMNGLWG